MTKLIIDKSLARYLIDKQFPEWGHLSIEPVKSNGWDNVTFHLGKELLIRMPSALEYAGQAEKEQTWLPKLAKELPLPIPAPVALGAPEEAYPLKWSINRWLPGESALSGKIADLSNFGRKLAEFLRALQSIDASKGPLAGEHSFYRGSDLAIYDLETRQAIELLKNELDGALITEIWERALSTIWQHEPVWVHGDISQGNLLVENGQLSAVIDFGQLAVGDPACDLAIAWNFFKAKEREAFFNSLELDSETLARGRGWALWKALILVSGLCQSTNMEKAKWFNIIEEICNEYKHHIG